MNAVVYGYLNIDGNNSDENQLKITKEAFAVIKNKKVEELEKTTNIKLNETKTTLIEKRNLFLGSKCQTFYTSDPFVVSRAFMQYIFDEQGNRFLDCISNVQHVGHCHPHVVQAIATQSSLSTCNIRFVCPLLGECSKALINTLHPSLNTIFYCNSGSEANDLALQLARDWTGGNDAIVLENAYHGHITTAAQLSPYKSEHGANIKKPEWVHIAPTPDVYRGKYRLLDEELNSPESLQNVGELYSKDVCLLIEELNKNGRKIAAFFAEALQSCGGQIIPPPGYFQSVAKAIHDNGGLVVVDEVQTGFGRVGDTFWAHQLFGHGEEEFIPDIITMGKPMGNGYPVSAVVTRREIADKLCGNAEYFNTYGGNPVACAASLAVLQIIEKEHLLKHSKQMGILFKQKLEILKSKHFCIGDIRGVGMFWGLDLVKCRKTREPANNLAKKLILKLRKEYGILLNADGPFGNVLKFKPPLCFNSDNLENVIKAIDECLNELKEKEN